MVLEFKIHPFPLFATFKGGERGEEGGRRRGPFFVSIERQTKGGPEKGGGGEGGAFVYRERCSCRPGRGGKGRKRNPRHAAFFLHMLGGTEKKKKKALYPRPSFLPLRGKGEIYLLSPLLLVGKKRGGGFSSSSPSVKFSACGRERRGEGEEKKTTGGGWIR